MSPRLPTLLPASRLVSASWQRYRGLLRLSAAWEFVIPAEAAQLVCFSGNRTGAGAGAAPEPCGVDRLKAARYAAPELFSSDIAANPPVRADGTAGFSCRRMMRCLLNSIGAFEPKTDPAVRGLTED